MKVLLLNASEEVLGVIGWYRAVTLLMGGKAREPFAFDDAYNIRTTSGNYRLPTAIVLQKYIRFNVKRGAMLTKENILRRDDYTCQYCGDELSSSSGTLDHVLPQSRGGPHTWLNLVSCCQKCNCRKADKTPAEAKMPLMRKPFQPSREQIMHASLHRYHRPSWSRWIGEVMI